MFRQQTSTITQPIWCGCFRPGWSDSCWALSDLGSLWTEFHVPNEMNVPLQVIDGSGSFNTEEVEEFAKGSNLIHAGLNYQIIAIMGPQSSGKSTLLNHVVGPVVFLPTVLKGNRILCHIFCQDHLTGLPSSSVIAWHGLTGFLVPSGCSLEHRFP